MEEFKKEENGAVKSLMLDFRRLNQSPDAILTCQCTILEENAKLPVMKKEKTLRTT